MIRDPICIRFPKKRAREYGQEALISASKIRILDLDVTRAS